MTPMKESWLKLYQPITENLKLDMRMNLKSKKVPTPSSDRVPEQCGFASGRGSLDEASKRMRLTMSLKAAFYCLNRI